MAPDATPGDLVLVADNEPDIRRFVEINLRLEGFEVALAADGEEALRQALELRPALILLDVMMPRLDGFEVCRRLRADVRTSHIPVIILTAKSMTADKVVGLTAGADDYVLKPFEPVELVARVRTTLRRARELRATSPLTGLPGNHAIARELAVRLSQSQPLALVYADLNDFKAYNDRYGFLRGDDVITMASLVLTEALQHSPDAFVGHIGGDDFMFVCPPEEVVEVCQRVIRSFEAKIASFYDDEDKARGYVEVVDRRGDTIRYPFVSIALGVASTEKRKYADHREIVETATQMKRFLKQHHRFSAYAMDGRVSGGDGAPVVRR